MTEPFPPEQTQQVPVDGSTAATQSQDAPAQTEQAPENEAEQYLRLLQRERADFANYRRRMDEERQQLARDANLQLLLRLLPVLDDFERVLANASEDERSSPWGQGVLLVERKLRGLLASEGVQPVEAEGAHFNPWDHEAVSYQPSDAAEEGTILHVVRTGYRKGDRVIRPAQVVVAGRP